MGNQGSAERPRDATGHDGKGGKDKKKSFLNCQCGKGRDDKDEINGENRGTKGTKLTEEEWAQVKTGRLHVERGQPDLVLEESEQTKVPPRSRLYKESESASEGRAGEGRSRGSATRQESRNPYKSASPGTGKPQVKVPERFKVGDRVKCACKKW